MGLSRFPDNAHEPLMLIKGDISQEKPMEFKKNLQVVIISISDKFPFLCISKRTLIGFTFMQSVL